jgi:DNA-binding GntR family transcriptional regulator
MSMAFTARGVYILLRQRYREVGFVMTAPRSADQIHAALSAEIVTGTRRPGDMLGEIALADRFGMSRTPVREALQRLASEGLLERGPRRAFRVRRMTQQALRHLFEALGELEALCAGMAALRMTSTDHAVLARILEEPDGDYVASNIRFHDALRLGAQNHVLSDLLVDLDRRSLPWRNAQFLTHGDRIKMSRAEHRAIVEAVVARDADGAAALMRAHMGSALGTVLAMIETRD